MITEFVFSLQHIRLKKELPHLSHGMRHSGRLRRLTRHIPSKCNGIARDPAAVYVGAAPHDGSPHAVRDPGAGPAQGHGAFGRHRVEPAAQATNTHGVIARINKVGGASGGVGGVQGLDVLHGEGLSRTGEAASGAAAAVASVAKARRAGESRRAARAP